MPAPSPSRAAAPSTKRPRVRRRWVVKAGSNMVCTGGPLLLRDWMRQVARLRREHAIEVIWVTSGAIASASDRIGRLGQIGGTGARRRERTLDEKQALSAIGQPLVMDLYNLSLQAVGLLGAQILLTYDDLADPDRRANFQNTIERLLRWDAVPILNENDAVATQEIRFGDNDSLSAKVAHVAAADRLVILTDVEGLHDADPRTHPAARLIGRVPSLTPEFVAGMSGSAGSTRGTGGMYSKLKAALEATQQGVETWLVKGDIPSVLLQVAGDEAVGTRIAPRPTARRNRKR